MDLLALVFDTDLPFVRDGAPVSALTADRRLAGLSLLRRAILLAWRAGAESAVVIASDSAAASKWAASERALPIPVRVVGPGEPLPEAPGNADVLVLSAQLLADAGLLQRLVATSRELGRPAVAHRPALGCPGPAVLKAATVAGAVTAGYTAAEAVRQLCRTPEAVVVSTGERGLRRLDDSDALARADREMYRGLTSVTDGYIDRVFNRRISAWCTRRIINLPVTPNHVTSFHFALGLLAAWCFWQGAYWQQVVGAVLFQLSVALDCTDGEIARLKFQFSRFGSRLDVAADNVVTIAVFAAIARAAAGQLGSQLSVLLGVLAVLGVLMSVFVVFAMARMQESRRPGEASSLSVTNRLSDNDQVAAIEKKTLIDRVINEATSRDFSVVVVACALVGHLEWFAWLAAVGSHIFWISFGAIQLSMLKAAHAQGR